MTEEIKDKITASDLVLVGIGMDYAPKGAKREEMRRGYDSLAEWTHGKDYFVVTLLTDDVIYESRLDRERIVAPCGSEAAGNVVTNEDYDESIYLPQWEVYTTWLQRTLNKKLCVLELGAGFQFPSVIRFPFEKVAYFNKKASFIRVHPKLAQLTPEIKEKSISISEYPVKILNKEKESL